MLKKQVAFMGTELDRLEAEAAKQVDTRDVAVATEESLREERVRVLQEALSKIDQAYAELEPQRRLVTELKTQLSVVEERELAFRSEMEGHLVTTKEKDKTLESLRQELTQTKAQLNQRDKEAQSKEKEWRAESAKLKVELATLQKTNTALQRQVEKANKDDPATKDLRQKLQRVEKQLEDSAAQCEQAQAMVDHVTVKLAQKDEQLGQVVQTHTAQVKDMESQLIEHVQETGELRTQLARFESSRKMESDAVQRLHDEKNKICEQMTEITFQLEEERMVWGEREKELICTQTEVQLEVDQLTKKLIASQAQIQERTNEVEELQRRLKSAVTKATQNDKSELQELELEILRLSNLNSNHVGQIKTLHTEMLPLQRSASLARDFEQKLRKAEFKCQELGLQLEKSIKDLAIIKAHTKTVLQDNEKLTKQLEQQDSKGRGLQLHGIGTTKETGGLGNLGHGVGHAQVKAMQHMPITGFKENLTNI